MDKTKVAIIGLGNVGQGVAKLLLDHGDRTARHAGRTLWLEKAVVRDLNKARDCDVPSGLLTADVDDVINNREIKVVAQLIGGLEPERTIMLQLLESGKDVVTANKALLAEHGPELFDRARELGRSIAFEASVAGGIPIIANISQCLSANQILSLDGILNGTTNFILSKMHEEGMAYADALNEAQRLGYAEADPTLDVDGSDAAQKARDPGPPRVRCPRRLERHSADGHRSVGQERCAFRPGNRLSHQAVGGRRIRWRHTRTACFANAREARPTAIGCERFVQCDSRRGRCGRRTNVLPGAGAGQMPTASAVVADMIDTAVGRTAITFRTLELWSNRKAMVTPREHAKADGRFYLRVNADDHPGVLAQVANVLGQHHISISSVLQQEIASPRRLGAAGHHDTRNHRRRHAAKRVQKSTS